MCVQCWGGKGQMVTGTLWGLGTGTPSTEDVRQWLHSLGHATRGGDGCNSLGTLQQWARPFGNPAVGTNCQGLRWGHLSGDLDLGTHSKAGSGGIHQGMRWEGFSVCVPLDTLWGHASKGMHPMEDVLQGWQWVYPFGDTLAVGATLGGQIGRECTPLGPCSRAGSGCTPWGHSPSHLVPLAPHRCSQRAPCSCAPTASPLRSGGV